MVNKKIIAIDLGNGYVKVAVEGKVFKFKSIYREGKKSSAIEKGYSLGFNGVDYVVGSGNLACTISSSKITDISTLLFILTAINLAYPNENNLDKIEVVLGLPSEYYKSEKNILRKHVLENLNTVSITTKPINEQKQIEIEDISVSTEEIKKIVNVTSCKVCMQAAVYTIAPELFENRKVLVIDMGAGTLDCVMFVNYELDERIKTFEVGMNDFWDRLVSNLNIKQEVTNKFKTKEDVIFNIERGFFTFQRTEHKINDPASFVYCVIQKTLSEHFQEALNSVESFYVAGALDNIIITGGAAEFVREYFEKTLGACEIISYESDFEVKKTEQQQFTNVINYYNLATM